MQAVFAGEFGRTPTAEKSNGRDHNISGFTLWMAGAGMKPGYSHGATDDIGFSAVQSPVHIPDFHATILHTLGLKQEKRTYCDNGLDRKPTGTEGGRVVRAVCVSRGMGLVLSRRA